MLNKIASNDYSENITVGLNNCVTVLKVNSKNHYC